MRIRSILYTRRKTEFFEKVKMGKLQGTAIIIGAGPAGLTAAYELVHRTEIKPIIYEMTGDIGGLARTVNYKGNRIDTGGHRFFSKSNRVIQWWLNILPLQRAPSKDDIKFKRYVPLSKEANGPDPEKTDRVMLIRNRVSRIFFLRKFFNYPLSIDFKIFSNLGAMRILRIVLSYLRSRLFPIREERTLEDFFINRFGREMYLTFFENYTEKVWGIPCKKIKADWGSQRIKGLSITKAIADAVRKIFFLNGLSLAQKNIETSLIKQFMYPKFGPGQLWEEIARIVEAKGGKIYLNHRTTGLRYQDSKIVEVEVKDETTGKIITAKGDYFFSTMPVKDLIQALGEEVPAEVQQIAGGLVYRDFVIAGLLLRRLKIGNKTSRIKTINGVIPDNWIYMQEKDVKVGRIQIFNNWSPYMVKDENTMWIGLEYFCNEGDWLWNKSDGELTRFAIDELIKIGFIEKEDFLDSVVIRVPKTYPAYNGVYGQFHIIRDFTDRFRNLFLVGRNGMHRYNNSDHSMLTAMVAVDNVINGIESKDNIWAVNENAE